MAAIPNQGQPAQEGTPEFDDSLAYLLRTLPDDYLFAGHQRDDGVGVSARRT